MAAASISEQNEQLSNLYKMAGIDPQGIESTETTTSTEKAKETETVFVRIVDGKTFSGRDEVEVLNQIAAYAEAKTAPAAKPAEQQKPATKTLSKDESFAIGMELMSGKAEAIDKYLEGSDYLNRELAKHGVTLDQVKQVVAVTSNQVSKEKIESAAGEWLKRTGNDWPGGEGNKQILGFKLAAMKLDPSSPDSYQKAYEQMKTEGMVLPVKTESAGKRKAAGSTSFATGSNETGQKPENSEIPTISQAAWAKLKPAEQQALYNELVSQGHDPAKIKFVA